MPVFQWGCSVRHESLTWVFFLSLAHSVWSIRLSLLHHWLATYKWLDVTWVNKYSFENSSNSVETNFGPLSDLKISGIPFLANMDFNAHIVSLVFWDASGIDISKKRE